MSKSGPISVCFGRQQRGTDPYNYIEKMADLYVIDRQTSIVPRVLKKAIYRKVDG